MKELTNLLGYRESIKVVDATLRDGGLVNDFYFTDDFVKALYQANIEAGVGTLCRAGYNDHKIQCPYGGLCAVYIHAAA